MMVEASPGVAAMQAGLKTSIGLTPLHNAATNGHTAALDALLSAGEPLATPP